MTSARPATWIKLLSVLPLLFALPLSSQAPPKTEPAAFLHSNDRFGMNLLNEVYKEAPGRNIALAPLPVSLTFAALLDGSGDFVSRGEIVPAFTWQNTSANGIAGRMLHAHPLSLRRTGTRPFRFRLWQVRTIFG